MTGKRRPDWPGGGGPAGESPRQERSRGGAGPRFSAGADSGGGAEGDAGGGEWRVEPESEFSCVHVGTLMVISYIV